ncbi:uncharacterized protein LOC113496988 [Trichoplusia ni]|uniref:Uncharacterized protein LOC113496988 n=1 Tax=Trichoplusia ni TaxID=7111 RepID=A0A7E5VVB0_TRINI|nr:uncharacterized protein LOC113496988 [Trichoplusia ni]
MGEQFALTTWPRHHNIFYRITSSAINFEVKAPGNAGIGLSSKAGPTCDYIIGIGHNRHSWIKKMTVRVGKETVETPNILSPQEYRKFWVSWYGDILRLGRDGETKPIVAYNCRNSNLKYITFSAIDDNRNPVHWRIELPPLLEKPLLKPVTGGELYWVQVDADTQFPDGAFIGGYEKENLYIIRANHRGSLTPGKFVSSEGLGYIPWGGEANVKSFFEVLCGYNCTWVSTKLDNIPVGAVVAGHSEDSGHERLYVGRARYFDHIIPGKVQPSHKVCYIAFDGKEVSVDNYEILVVPDKNRSANKFLLPPVDMNIMVESEDENDDIDDHSMNYDNYDGFFYADPL